MGSFASVSLARLTPSRHPKTRRLLRVEIADPIVTDRVINELMGKDPSARFGLIMNKAEEAVQIGSLNELVLLIEEKDGLVYSKTNSAEGVMVCLTGLSVAAENFVVPRYVFSALIACIAAACGSGERGITQPSPQAVLVHNTLNPPDSRASRSLVHSFERPNQVGFPFAYRRAYDDFTSAVTTTIRTVSWQGGTAVGE